jgi:glycosyltransferase involved in cell wall biosynthesis
MIRVLHVIGALTVGGAEMSLMNLYRNIDREKIQFDFLVFYTPKENYEEEVISMGANIIYFETPKKNYFKYIKNLKKIIISGNYDIVHGHTLFNSGLVSYAAYKCSVKKRIAHSRSAQNKENRSLALRLYQGFMRFLILRYSTDLLAVSQKAGEYLFKKKSFTVLRSGRYIEYFLYNSQIRQKIRDEFKVSNKFVIGHVGRICNVKNHTFLIDAFIEVHRKNSNAVLLLIGDGELKPDIENKVNKAGLKDNVIFTGFRSDVNELLQAMDVFVLPSLYEGLPGAVTEAQISGLRCIVSDTVTNETNFTGLAEFVSLKESPTHWAEKILFYANGYERENMSESAKKAGFDIKENAKWLQEFYMKGSSDG